jgi:predicted nucleic acid-binding protein
LARVRSTATRCMSADTFTLDTSILAYAMDVRAGARHMLAADIVELAVQLDCVLTLQAISEFYAAVSRKRLAVVAEACAQAEDWLTLFRTAAASADATRAALISAASGRASYWDALLVATAAEAGCMTILTEDLTDGSSLHGVRILNPFSGTALTPAAATLLALG